jgi:hypothetical protein
MSLQNNLQKTCGSCWAYAATGSLETSAARNEANSAYDNYLEIHLTKKERKHSKLHGMTPKNDTTMHLVRQEAMAYAQQVELEVFDMVNLSIQELIDCDVGTTDIGGGDGVGDQGCTGGNPLLAFYFIHKYGLTTWSDYPYAGRNDGITSANGIDNPYDTNTTTETMCQWDLVAKPMATVASWGILPKNDENLIQLALRYIGPVAVGFNGNDPAFLAYAGGIFNKQDCDTGVSNHAMLIVGYGEEEQTVVDTKGAIKTETIRYWIVRNSWGEGWGENGYIRIKRGAGGTGLGGGVCGVSRNPSVALGGKILIDRKLPVPSSPRGVGSLQNKDGSQTESNGGGDGVNPHQDGFRALCDHLYAGPLVYSCGRLAG